jgi:hypothetical protein
MWLKPKDFYVFLLRWLPARPVRREANGNYKALNNFILIAVINYGF